MKKRLVGVPAAALVAVGLTTASFGADHGDGPDISGSNRTADIGDGFLFLDPNDNSRLVIAMTTLGFIPPAEAVNFGVFDPKLLYRFELETTGDASPDAVFNVRFGPKQTSAAAAQTALVILPDKTTFQAPTTVPNLSPTSPAPVVTRDPATGIDFFAGVVDDPFPFDIVGFGQFVASVLAGAPNVFLLDRARDSFAGYNTLGIALSVPVSLLGQVPNGVVGLNVTTVDDATGIQHDRAGTPAVNTSLVPFPRRDEHNAATPVDDAAGVFANALVGTLTALGTSQANINLLAGLVVTNGDYLRMNLGVPNSGPAGGTNPEAAFPNGRRMGDDVIDTVIAVVTNGARTAGDEAEAELPPRNVFPFFPPSHQPFPPGTIDDRTRN